MERQPVVSGNLAAVGYDEARQYLEVEFRIGTVYGYTGVPKKVYEEMIAASSVGHYFAASVRACYPMEKLSSTQKEEVNAVEKTEENKKQEVAPKKLPKKSKK